MNRPSVRLASTVSLIVLVAFGLTAIRASADVIVAEQFVYELGSLIDGQEGGLGFAGPWSASKSHGRDYVMQFEGLTFRDENLDELDAAGNSLSRFGSAGRAETHRVLAADAQEALTRDDTTIWFGLLVAAPSAHRWGSFCLGTYKFSTQGMPVLGDGDDDRNPPYVPMEGEGFGLTLMTATSDAGDGTINALAFNGDSAPVVSPGTFTQPIQPGATHHDTSLIVGKINWGAGGAADELFLFNVTDMSTEPPEDEAIASITDLDLDQAEFTTLAVWDTNNTIFDEVRFGTTFFDAVGSDAIERFLRADSNNDGAVNVSDPVSTLNHLFASAPEPPCFESADSNDDGSVNITDAVYTLNHLFAGGPAPLPPYPECGPIPTAENLGCVTPPAGCN